MALLDVIIDILKINCSVVQCTGYASDIEALFYLFFFPTVFIILFIWVVTSVIITQIGGKAGGLRILISVALYAFIVFEGYYTLFVSLSQLWWLLLATLVGLYIFIRKIIHGNGGGVTGGRSMAGVGSKPGILQYPGKKFKRVLEEKEKKKIIKIKQEISNLKSSVNIMEKEINNPSPGTDMTKMIKSYHQHKAAILADTDELSEVGKASALGIDWKIEDKGQKYEDELKELDKRVEEITNKWKDKLKKAA